MSWWTSLAASESQLYWRVTIAAFFAIGLWEILKPSRSLTRGLLTRWGSHWTLLGIAIAMNWLVVPIGLVAGAFAAQKTGYGQFIISHVPYVIRFVAAILLLDLWRYAVHYASHSFAPLWRIHSIHHSDTDFDLSTGFRHHPLEALFAQVVELVLIFATAPPPEAVLLSEIAAGAQSIAMHANAAYPPAVERFLRYFLITPSFHLVHHSTDRKEQNANFGTLFPWWDRMFHTCTEQPRLGDAMQIGLDGVQERRALNLRYLLAMPFGRMPGRVEEPKAQGIPPDEGRDSLAR